MKTLTAKDNKYYVYKNEDGSFLILGQTIYTPNNANEEDYELWTEEQVEAYCKKQLEDSEVDDGKVDIQDS